MVTRSKTMNEAKAGRRGLFRTAFLSLLALNLVVLSGPARAQEDEVRDKAERAQDAVASEGPNQDLLLFWEEKELYVQTATRTAKPISQVAENIEVITAKDIEDMNAHTVDEVLNRVPGLFVDFETNDFNSPAQFHIQGGAARNVTVLVDGVVWNFLVDGHAETVTIPVGIIDRIEIIKGPASSAWGSGLAGVVNIITKGTGDSSAPKGTLFASYGTRYSRDLNAQIAGQAGKVGYYLYAGHLASDGLAITRRSNSDSAYGKFTLSPAHNMDLTFTVGYSTPDLGQGNQHASSRTLGNIDTFGDMQLTALHATSALDYRISPDLALKAEVNTLHFKFGSRVNFTSPNEAMHVQRGDYFKSTVSRDSSTSGNVKLIYTGGKHTAVLGVEASHGEDSVDIMMPWRSLGAVINSGVDRWGIFTNDSLTLGNFAVTPGIRFDHDSISGSFVSPSLGTTYQFSEHSIARASIARGFTRPDFAFTSGGGAFYQGNRDITAEQGWSYQVGVESALLDRVNLKATLFRHDIDNAISDGVDPQLGKFINIGKVVRQGYEVSAESAPVYNTSLKIANSYVHIDQKSDLPSTDLTSYQVGLKYDDRSSWLVQVFGSYIGWDLPPGTGRGNGFIWDANVNKRFLLINDKSMELFFNVHNIFSDPHTTALNQPNPGRWVEGGLKCRF